VTSVGEKVEWEGTVVSVQPRIRRTRSFDQRSHSDLGYVLRMRGTLAGDSRGFAVALGKGGGRTGPPACELAAMRAFVSEALPEWEDFLGRAIGGGRKKGSR